MTPLKATFVALLNLLASTAYAASPHNCGPAHALRKCRIVGSSQGKAVKTYYASCSDAKEQIEYIEGASLAALIDPTSRRELAKCEIDKNKFATLIKDYASQYQKLADPRCYLTQWKGQMMFVANGVKGRCSFNMNAGESQEFHAKTGVTALYQCENGYFLAMGEKTAASVYKKSKTGWELDCKAAIRIGDPVENIDWKNPPAYWSPEAGALGPNFGVAAKTTSTQF